MPIWNFTNNALSLVATLDTESGTYEPQSISFKMPSFVLINDSIKAYESGEYKKTFKEDDIGTINGDTISGIENILDALISLSTTGYREQVVVRHERDLANIDSSKEYFIDGVINVTSSIIVPSGGISLRGFNYVVSKLVSTEDNLDLLVSDVGGSGNIIISDMTFDVSGTNSRVYNLTGATGFEAIEHNIVNFENCTSLGVITNYRQGLEVGTGRFGGKPTLELDGNWNGYRISTSITRQTTNTTGEPLFKAGSTFVMSGSFICDMNVDLGTDAPFADFSQSNFSNINVFRLDGMRIFRSGNIATDDSITLPNISKDNLACRFLNNEGLQSTVIGGEMVVTAEVATVVSATGTYYDLAGTYNHTNLVHFDSSGNGQLRCLEKSPREYIIFGNIVLSSTANDVVDLKVVIYRSATTSFEDAKHISRVVNNLSGGRDVAYFSVYDIVTLGENDYIKIQAENKTSIANITAELDSYITIKEK